MRLSSIKLSGFKSFVDPTHIPTPGQLVAIVGPNGCGKSNVIDAVRWVLGESKASALRGESMQDVIFNGAGDRKRVGRASVELVFDNSLGRVGGQWGQFAELSIKRVLTREGDSTYYINSQIVRRRDITDLFMGTGLGPRAYAIIEQGMISRIIEAKPEEMRVFLEEAAGVSKYRERRRETEARLSDAKDNLARIDDIRRELGSQLEKLEAQAKVAAEYRDFEARLHIAQQVVWSTRMQEAGRTREKLTADIAQLTADLEGLQARLHEKDAQIEVQKATHYQSGHALHAAQAEFYAANAEVSRHEQQLQYARDSQQRLAEQMADIRAQLAALEAQQAQAAGELQAAEAALESAIGGHEQAGQVEQAATQALPALEQAVRAATQAQGEVDRALGEAEQGLRVNEANHANAGKALAQWVARRERLEAEQRQVAAPVTSQIEAVQEQMEQEQATLAEQEAEIAAQNERVERARQQRTAAAQQAQQSRTALTELEARLGALSGLQAKLENSPERESWLKAQGLTGARHLWQAIQVATGWENALEAVLRERLNALGIADLEVTGDWADTPKQLSVYAQAGRSDSDSAGADADSGSLLAMVEYRDRRVAGLVRHWLHGVRCAESLAAALAQRGTLAVGQTMVTPQGHLVTPYSVTYFAPDSELHGVLARQREIDELTAGHAQQKAATARLEAALAEAESSVKRAQDEYHLLTAAIGSQQRRAHDLELELMQLRAAAETAQKRLQQIERELGEIAQSHAQEKASQSALESAKAELQEKRRRLLDQREARRGERNDAEVKLTKGREALRAAERATQEARFAERAGRDRLADLQRRIAAQAEQHARLAAQAGKLEGDAGIVDLTPIDAALQAQLQVRQVKEAALAAARDQLAGIEGALRALEEERMRIEQDTQPARARIEEVRLKEQAALLQEKQYAEQLQAVGADLAKVAELILGGARSSLAEIDRLQKGIAALGAVNLAALEELNATRERKDYLDKQAGDLTEASDTLMNAIRRIDRETRALLQETFDSVNLHFGKLFPTLFGGGQAKLMMTGEEILDAGVQVLAQPPGKRNTSIHLLSGGEKALTALSLVFAIFQLNPAPFCLLDEVDAPLDDANTERFARLVQAMSTSTQFLYISHNKISMEMASQLVGITMPEAGVSRVVAVDIAEAVGMAEPIAA
ncbi:MAG: chromosome segregation protein SMC [Betaproteobacteria bacterium]|nr:chromosome segregation protein SMC [Betaproteobacteria bacterium]